MTVLFDKLYQRSKENKIFTNLIEIICSKENVALAFNNLKHSGNSKAPGFDNKTVEDLGSKTVDELQQIIISKMMNCKPKPVIIVEIPISDGRTRPLGITCIADRLFQQCIKQVLEPICEARFYNYSFGFRPNRTVSQAIARSYFLMQKNKLSYCIDIALENFYENISHEILIKQLWNMGIREKRLLSVIKAMLRAEIILPDKTRTTPEKGCSQTGLLSPLFVNVFLNDLDWWISSQWSDFKTRKNYERVRVHNGKKAYMDKSNKYTELKRTSNLKEMYIVRYGEDFKIFCRSYPDAKRAYEAVTQWLAGRLKLSIDSEQSGITNLRQCYISFLGFRMKLKQKSTN